MWLEQTNKNPEDGQIRRKAVAAIQFCLPEQAEAILTEAKDEAGLGRLYGGAVLGITGESYRNNDPSGSDPSLRERPFAAKARRVLEEATDRSLLVAGAEDLLRDGAILWADGKLDWDYTPIGNLVLAKAKAAAPDEMTPPILRVGGNAQAKQSIRKISPTYPPDARARGIQGTVRMTALIGPDGKILFLRPESGPTELIPGSMEAVRQWRYKPTLLNGRPCYILTLIDVNYVL
jgi:hypothetical protein